MTLWVQEMIDGHPLKTAIAIVWGVAICAPLAKERLEMRLIITVLFERAWIGSPQNPHGLELEPPATSPNLSARFPSLLSSPACADSTDSKEESSGACHA